MKTTRRTVQFTFLALTLSGVFLFGANCERWCPFGGVEALHAYLTEGTMVCSLGTSNFFILGGVLAMTVLLRRAFCGYVCPIGTLSEWLNSLGRRPLPFETNYPGLFAVGDVRAGSTKRVAAAVGEGSAAVRSVHEYLAFAH